MYLKSICLAPAAMSVLFAFSPMAAAEPPEVAQSLEALGAIRGEAAIQALDGVHGRRAEARGGSLEKLKRALSRDRDAWLMPDGTALYVDTMAPSSPQDVTVTSAEPRPLPVPDGYASSGLPLHHSLPGATNKIFLDFDGVDRLNPICLGSNQGRPLQGLDLDGAPRTFNAAEQAAISRVWARVAEDWAPFNVDVTTEEPAQSSKTVLWSIFTKASDAGFPRGIGGVAPFSGNSLFGKSSCPCFTFLDAYGATNDSGLADTASQEQGHIFGLSHDGTDIDGRHVEYYSGHGTGPTSWGPLMGDPNNRNVTQFSRGEYAHASNQEDDLAIIAADLGWRPDDVCNEPMRDSPPIVLGQTYWIESPSDVDVFALPQAIPPFGTEVALDITPFRADQGPDGGNLDVAADIIDARGDVIATSDPAGETQVQRLAVTLPPGRQSYLRVRPSFAPGSYPIYGSLGQYTVTGLLPNQLPIPVARRQPLNCLAGQ